MKIKRKISIFLRSNSENEKRMERSNDRLEQND